MQDENKILAVIYFVDYSIIAGSDAVSTLSSSDFPGATGTRFAG